MINSNYSYKVGNIYNFGVSASSASPVKCIFDRPVKKIRPIAGLDLYSPELLEVYASESESMPYYEFPSIYGYPVELTYVANGAATNVPVVIEVAEYGDKPNFEYFKAHEALLFTVGPESAAEEVLGKTVSTIQSDVVIDEASGKISGTLAYIENWTEYSAIDNTGHFLVLAITSSETATFKLWKASKPERVVTFDEDMNAVIKIDDLDDMLYFSAEDANGVKTVKTFTVRDLILEVE